MYFTKKLLLALVIASASTPLRAAEKIRISSLSTVLTEIAQKVGGEHVEVFGLMQAGVDPHEYEPKPSDLKMISDSRLTLTSGKHLEPYLDKLQEASGGKGSLLKVGDQLPGPTINPEARLKDEADRSERTVDPHWWNSVSHVQQATKIVRDQLSQLDPANKAAYEANAGAFLAKLDELERWVKRKVAELPRDRRKLVTSHDAFQYFARAYGFSIAAVEGISTETDPSNRHVAELIDEIKREGVKAIFIESTLNPKVTQEITRETGTKIGGTLYADGLGTGAASSYEGMMKHNVSTIVEALK